MNNSKQLLRFEEAGSARISKLFWIASCWETYDLKSFLNDDVQDDDYEKYLPEVFSSKHFSEHRDSESIEELMYDHNKFGFMAEVLFPICSRFSYNKDGTPSSWTSSGGHCRMSYIYAETPALLLKQIEKEAKVWFAEFIKEDMAENEPNAQECDATDAE